KFRLDSGGTSKGGRSFAKLPNFPRHNASKTLGPGTLRITLSQFTAGVERQREITVSEGGNDLLNCRVLQRRVLLVQSLFDRRLSKLFRRRKFIKQAINRRLLRDQCRTHPEPRNKSSKTGAGTAMPTHVGYLLTTYTSSKHA